MIDKDTPTLGIKQSFKLEKFDGQKVPGDGKKPVEVITGGDGKPTIRHNADGSKDILSDSQLKEALNES